MHKILAPSTSYCKMDISRLGAQRSEGILKHAQQFQKQAGGVHFAITKPRGLSLGCEV